MSTRKLIMLPARLSALFALALAALPALAAEGRIPIAAPMVIVANGKYIVTNNLVGPGPGGPVITINAPNVDIDLNGFVLSQAGVGAPVISAPAVAIGADHLTIRNGTISGGAGAAAHGIDVPGGAPHRKVVIENVLIKDCGGHGIHLGDVPGATIRNNEITACFGSGIQWDGPGAVVKTGTIENNVIRAGGSGIVITSNCSSVAILTNRLDAFTSTGILLIGCNGSLISENTVEEARGAQGIFLRQSSKNKLYNNVVTLSCLAGIHLDLTSNNNLVLNNNSSGNVFCAGAPADGITDEGTQNVIQGNVLNSNQRFGLLIAGVGGAPPVPPAVGPPGCGNTYGRNTARGNAGAGPAPPFGCGPLPAGQLPPQLCIGTGAACAVPNTSFGDNLMPGPPVG